MTEPSIHLVFRSDPPAELLAVLERAGLTSHHSNALQAAQCVSEGSARAVVCERVPGWQALVTRVEAAGGAVVLFGDPPAPDELDDRVPEQLDLEIVSLVEEVPDALNRALALIQAKASSAMMPFSLEERVRRAELVNRFAQSIASQMGLPNVVEEAMARARDLCDACGASLLLVDQASGELCFTTVAGGSTGVKEVRLKMGEGIAGKVAQRAKSMLVQDTGVSTDFNGDCDRKTGFQTGSIIAVPLILSGDVIGVLEAVRETTRAPFEPGHLRRLEDLAPHVTIAVHNARMNAQLRDSQELVLRNNAQLEQKVQERTTQIARAKKEWEQTFDAISDPIALVDNFVIRRANLAYAKRAGLSIKDLPGKRCHEVFAHRSSPCVGCPLAAGVSAKGDLQGEVKIGRNSVYALSGFRMGETSENGPSGVVVVNYRDVTEERTLQGRLRESERLAALGQLASGAAHEINNPLGFLISNLNGLRSLIGELDGNVHGAESTELLRDGKEMIDESLQGAQRVGSIVRALRELSKLEIGRAEPCDVNASASRAVRAEFIDPLDATRVTLDLQAQRPALVTPLQLDQLLGQILRNARQATKAGQRVSIHSRDEGDFVVIEVRDEGSGIKPEHLNRVFEPFFSTRGVGQGVGLGLTAAYGIAKRHGGEIDVKSEPGKGAIFTVRLASTPSAPQPLITEDEPAEVSELAAMAN